MTLKTERSFFEACVDLAPETRASWLENHCADPAMRERVLALLRAHDDAEARGAMQSPPPLPEERQIGAYRLLERIGEGGMGTVWLAEQTEPVRRRVALKVIKPGMDTARSIARFEAERQALALMDHPNIAKVLDAGHDTDRPAVLRDGAGPRRADHRVLRRDQLTHARRATRAVRAGLPGDPARAPEGHHPPRHQAVERARHAARRQAGAEGDRLRHRQGDRATR